MKATVNQAKRSVGRPRKAIPPQAPVAFRPASPDAAAQWAELGARWVNALLMARAAVTPETPLAAVRDGVHVCIQFPSETAAKAFLDPRLDLLGLVAALAEQATPPTT